MLYNQTISNSRFRFTNHPGTGNKACKVSDKEKLRLSNVLIDRAKVDEFLKVLYGTGEKKIKVELSDRRTSNRWGTAWYMTRRVAIYRHTVWVFLHELAHVLNVKKDFTGATARTVKPHGPDFGKHLTCLYDLWMEFCDQGVDHGLPQTDSKPDKPNLNHDYFKFAEPKVNQWKVPQRRPRVVGGISLQVGDRVWFRYKGIRIYGTVEKINKKTCAVYCPATEVSSAGKWRVSPKLLNKDAAPEPRTHDIDIPITKSVYEGLKKAMAFDQPDKKKKISAAEREELMSAWRKQFRKDR